MTRKKRYLSIFYYRASKSNFPDNSRTRTTFFQKVVGLIHTQIYHFPGNNVKFKLAGNNTIFLNESKRVMEYEK